MTDLCAVFVDFGYLLFNKTEVVTIVRNWRSLDVDAFITGQLQSDLIRAFSEEVPLHSVTFRSLLNRHVLLLVTKCVQLCQSTLCYDGKCRAMKKINLIVALSCVIV